MSYVDFLSTFVVRVIGLSSAPEFYRYSFSNVIHVNVEKLQFLDKTIPLDSSGTSTSTTYSLSPTTTSIGENTPTLSFTITRSGDLIAETIYVSTTSTTEGYSNNGDYKGVLNQAVSFGAGTTNAVVTVEIINDAILEEDETFGLIAQRNTDDSTSTFLAKSTFTITNDDTTAGNLTNLNFFINPEERSSKIQVTQGSFLVLNTSDLHGSGLDASAIDLGLTEGTSVYSFASGKIVGAFSGYTDSKYPIQPTSGPQSWGNYVTGEYFFNEIGKTVTITYAHLSPASVSHWVDAINSAGGAINISSGEKIGEVAGKDDSPFDPHLHLSIATSTLSGGNYPYPNYIAWAEPTSENTALLSELAIGGKKLSTLDEFGENNSITGTPIKSGVLTTPDRLFNWGEYAFNDLFPNHAPSQDVQGYYARIYENGNALGELNNNIYFYDGNLISLVGSINDFLSDTIAAGF